MVGYFYIYTMHQKVWVLGNTFAFPVMCMTKD